MKLLRFQAHNVLRLKDVDFSLAGHHLYLVGGDNEQGKTSALTAIRMALCGRSGSDYPEVALRDGTDEGWVKVDLGEDEKLAGLSIELLLKRSRGGNVVEKFRVVDADGREATSPRSLLDRLYQLKAFDPLAFERMPRKEKRELLVKLVGLDFTAEKQEYDRVFKERQDVNRDGKNLKARFDRLTRHPDAPAEEVSVAVLMSELEASRTVNAQNQRERERVGALEREINENGRKQLDADAEIQRLQGLLRIETEERQGLVLACNRLSQERDSQQDLVRQLKDRDEEAVKQQISAAGAMNAKFRANQEHAQVEAELAGLRKQSQELTDKLEQILDQQQKALQAAQWPVAGLSIDDEGVLYNGLPIEQESTSRRTIISTQIGMALNPRLRLLVCQGGNDLGTAALASLQQILEENNFQMLLESVTRSPADEARCAVVIEDGRVAGVAEASAVV